MSCSRPSPTTADVWPTTVRYENIILVDGFLDDPQSIATRSKGRIELCRELPEAKVSRSPEEKSEGVELSGPERAKRDR